MVAGAVDVIRCTATQLFLLESVVLSTHKPPDHVPPRRLKGEQRAAAPRRRRSDSDASSSAVRVRLDPDS